MSISTERTGRADDLLRPNNHELFDHVRIMAIAREPVLSWEEIAERVGVDSVPELLAWFLSYRLPPTAKLHHPVGIPSVASRPEYARLQDREASLVTLVTEAPRKLAAVRLHMQDMERPRVLRGVALRSAGL